MKKHRTLTLISLAIYFSLGLAASILAISMRIALDAHNNTQHDSLGEGLAGIGIALLLILATAYAILSILPVSLKLAHVFVPRPVFSAIGFVFDVAFGVIHGALLVGALASDPLDPVATVVYLLLLGASVVTFVLNVLTLREDRRLKRLY